MVCYFDWPNATHTWCIYILSINADNMMCLNSASWCILYAYFYRRTCLANVGATVQKEWFEILKGTVSFLMTAHVLLVDKSMTKEVSPQLTATNGI